MNKHVYILFFGLSLVACSGDDESHNVWIKRNTSETVFDIYSSVAGTNEKGYIGLNFRGENPFKDWWEYNPVKDQWNKKQDFPGAKRLNGIAASDGKNLYVGLGVDIDEKTNVITIQHDIWQYSAFRDEWLPLPDAPFSMGSYTTTPVSFFLGDRLYVISDQQLWSLDVNTQSWHREMDPPFLIPDNYPYLNSARAVVIHEKVYLLVSYKESQGEYYYSDLWSYTSANDSWKSIRGNYVKSVSGSVSVFAIGNTIYKFQDLANVNFNEEPNTEIGFRLINYPPTSRENGMGFQINGNIYYYDTNLWQYIP